MRKPTFVAVFFLTGFVAIFLTVLDAGLRQDAAMDLLQRKAKLVSELGLSDLALFTEARYTRHLSLADRHSAFQNTPASLDYFPSGSLYQAPAQLTP
jgi:hypothetical protein